MWDLAESQNAGYVAPNCLLAPRAATYAARPSTQNTSNVAAPTAARRPRNGPRPALCVMPRWIGYHCEADVQIHPGPGWSLWRW